MRANELDPTPVIEQKALRPRLIRVAGT